MTLIRKFAGHSALVVASLAVAMSLMLATSTAGTAAVNSVTASPTTVDGGNTTGATVASRSAQITIDADDGAGDVRVVTTAGTTYALNAIGADGGGTGNGTNDLNIEDTTAAGTVVIAGALDIDGSGVIDAADACASCAAGYQVIAGLIDISGNGATGAEDDLGSLFGFAVIDGGLDVDSSGAIGAGDALTSESTQNLNTITVQFLSPATGPGTASITVIQGSSVKSLEIKFRGNISTVTLETRLQTGPAAVTAVGTTVIQSTTATAPAGGALNAAAANLRATVTDSAGNGLNGVTVVYVTSDGSLVDTATLGVATGSGTTATVGTTRGVSNTVSLVHGTTGTTGDMATVTANAGGQVATVDVTFGGNATSCTVTAADTNVGAGGSTLITATFVSDADGTPIPDYSVIAGTGTASNDPNITAVNAVGTGTFAVTGQTPPVGGMMTATLTVGASGGTGVLASMGGTSVTCNTTVTVGTTTTPPTTPPGDGEFTGVIAPSGVSTVTFSGGTVADLAAAAAAEGAISVTVFVGGEAIVLIPGAPAFVNAAFNAQFTTGVPDGQIVLLVK